MIEKLLTLLNGSIQILTKEVKSYFSKQDAINSELKNQKAPVVNVEAPIVNYTPPEINIPKQDPVEIKVSLPDMPEIKIPVINVPKPDPVEVKVTIPEIKIPEIKLPKIVVPEPKVTVNVNPEIDSIKNPVEVKDLNIFIKAIVEAIQNGYISTEQAQKVVLVDKDGKYYIPYGSGGSTGSGGVVEIIQEMMADMALASKQLPDNHNVTVSNIGSVPVITGFATSDKQDTQQTTLDSILAGTVTNTYVNTVVTLTTNGTAYKLPSIEQVGRKYLVISNISNYNVYIGGSSVTTSSGILMIPGSTLGIDSESGIYAVSGTDAVTINIMELK